MTILRIFSIACCERSAAARSGLRLELHELARNDLPAQAELVLEPAAHRSLAAIGGELVPIVIDFLLRIDADEERHGFSELELRAAVQPVEALALDLEDRHEVALHLDLRVGEDRCVEIDGFLADGVVEPEERRDRGAWSLEVSLRVRLARSAREKPTTECGRRKSECGEGHGYQLCPTLHIATAPAVAAIVPTMPRITDRQQLVGRCQPEPR